LNIYGFMSNVLHVTSCILVLQWWPRIFAT